MARPVSCSRRATQARWRKRSNRFWNGPGSGRESSEQARRFVETERTWARSVARYADVYAALCPASATDHALSTRGE